MPNTGPTERFKHGRRAWKPGDPINSNDLSATAELVFRVLSGGKGIQVGKMGNGVTIASTAKSPGRGPGAAQGVRFAKIVEVKADFLVCEFWTPPTDTSSGEVFVAKPWMLRQDPFDGETIIYDNGDEISYVYSDQRTRVATFGSLTETQVMTPDYYRGEPIRINPGTTSVSTENGELAIWEDANTCGRFWARA